MPDSDLEQQNINFFLYRNTQREIKNMQFVSLAHLLNVDFLRKSLRSLNRNKALGLDNSIQNIRAT